MAPKKGSGLPDIIETGIQLLESLGKDRVSFLWVETKGERGCQFCGFATTLRLQAKTADDEVTANVICQGCRAAIIEAPQT